MLSSQRSKRKVTIQRDVTARKVAALKSIANATNQVWVVPIYVLVRDAKTAKIT
jgi:hypothetical protein